MAVAGSVAPDEVSGPDRHGPIDDQQLSVCRVRPHAGDAALRPRLEQRLRGRRVAVGPMLIEHETYRHTALDRTQQGPPI